MNRTLELGGLKLTVAGLHIDGNRIAFELKGRRFEFDWRLLPNGEIELRRDGKMEKLWLHRVNASTTQVGCTEIQAWIEELKAGESPAGVRSAGGARLGEELRAPLSGRICMLSAKAGQSLEAGQSLLSLEAMKMEHVLQAAGAGVVDKVHVEVGQRVEEGALLISFKKGRD